MIVVADSDNYLKNWSSSGGIWETVKNGSGTPSLDVGLLAKTGIGSGAMAILYAIIATLESWRNGVTDLVDTFWDFASDVVSVVYGEGVSVVSDGELINISGAADYVDSVYASAETSISGSALGFIVAFGLILGLALLVWGVRRYAI